MKKQKMMGQLRVILSCILLLVSIIACSPTPTETSDQSTSKPTTPVEIPTGWKNLLGDGVSLSLPSQYEGGNPGTDIERLESRLEAINPSYTERIEPIKQRTKAIALIAFDPQKSETETITNVSVIQEKLPENTDSKTVINDALEKISLVYEIVETKDVAVNNYQAKRIIAEADSQGTLIKPLLYLLVDKDTLWLVTYTTTATEFEQRLPNFEKSVKTFRVNS